MSKIIVLILFSFCLLGCAPSTSTFMKPEGDFGKATINGCRQIPSTFRYESKNQLLKLLYIEIEFFLGLKQ
jgi:hypothetical protein